MKAPRRHAAWPVWLAALWACSLAQTAFAGEFEKAYRAALENDASYQAAKYGLAVVQEAVPQARSTLLPTVAASISTTAVQGTLESAGTSTSLNYNAPTQSLTVRAPLLNMEALGRLRQAQAQVDAAQAQFASRQADLLDRLTIAYLQRLLAQDQFDTLHLQVKAVVEQRDLMRKRLERGEGTRTELAEARANLGLVTAQWADARDQITNTQTALETMVGGKPLELPRLGDSFVPLPLEPAALEAWQQQAASSNPEILAKRRVAAVAEAGVARSQAGHLPRLDLVASTSSSRNETASTLNQSLNQTTVGIQLNIPLYSGGAVDSAVRQALAEQARADKDLLAEQRQVALEVSRLYKLIQNGQAKLDAYQETLESSRIALDGTLKGQATGLRTNADVLEAVRKVSQAQRDLAQARYDHILQRLRLFNKAGMPQEAAALEVDALLTPRSAR